MKNRYKSFFKENRMQSYKAWFNPVTNYFKQFSTNGLHSEIAEQYLHCTEDQAFIKGYYRIFVGHEITIDSYDIPDDREFNSTKYIIEENSYKKFKETRWNIRNKRIFYFPKLTFLFSDSIKDGILKR